jgi:hypothetical protein
MKGRTCRCGWMTGFGGKQARISTGLILTCFTALGFGQGISRLGLLSLTFSGIHDELTQIQFDHQRNTVKYGRKSSFFVIRCNEDPLSDTSNLYQTHGKHVIWDIFALPSTITLR